MPSILCAVVGLDPKAAIVFLGTLCVYHSIRLVVVGVLRAPCLIRAGHIHVVPSLCSSACDHFTARLLARFGRLSRPAEPSKDKKEEVLSVLGRMGYAHPSLICRLLRGTSRRGLVLAPMAQGRVLGSGKRVQEDAGADWRMLQWTFSTFQ